MVRLPEDPVLIRRKDASDTLRWIKAGGPGRGRVGRMDLDFSLVAIGAAWLVIGGMLVWGVVDGLRKVLRNASPLPFFAALEGRGLTVAQVQAAVGLGLLVRAVRRCACCPSRSGCAGHAPHCPNQTIFFRAQSARTAP